MEETSDMERRRNHRADTGVYGAWRCQRIPVVRAMSCINCMDHKPSRPAPFTCPDCGKQWVLAGVWPGNYYESRSTHDEQKRQADKVIADVRSKL